MNLNDLLTNLDAMTAGELDTYVHQFPDVIYGLALLQTYAITKAGAMRVREQGAINTALDKEAQCNKMYDKLPEWAKW